MRSRTASTGCNAQGFVHMRAGHRRVRGGAARPDMRGRGARRAFERAFERAVRGACPHLGVASCAACRARLGGGRVRVLKGVADEGGQATVEAAFALPIALLLVLLLVQPGILLYDRIVMQGAAAEACRLLATTDEADASDT